MSNTRFKYDDYRKNIRAKGVDYFHLDTKEINAIINNFKVDKGAYSADVNSFNFIEKSGFTLNDLETKASVCQNGIFLQDLILRSERSMIEAKKFDMLSTGLRDFKYFVDSVKFDAKIDSSTIDLAEAALFAYVIDGMNDTVHLSTSIQKEVRRLKLVDFDLKTLNSTHIKGTLNLPDYRNPKAAFFQERIDYAYSNINELESIKLPNSFNTDYLNLDPIVNRLGYFKAEEIQLDGFYSQFVIAAENIQTNLGNVIIDNGVMFTQNEENNSYFFQRSEATEYDIKTENFDLGKLLNNESIGIIDGIFFLSGEANSVSEIAFTSIEGEINRLDYLNYPYNKISILEGSLIDGLFKGRIDVKDDNIDITYNGSISFKDELHLKFELNVSNALLDQLNISTKNSSISSHFKIDIRGDNPTNFRGSIMMDQFNLSEGKRELSIPSMQINMKRSELEDQFTIFSDIAQVNITGKVNISNIMTDFQHQFSRILPALFKNDIHKIHHKKSDHFEFDAKLGQSGEFLDIFLPDLRISPGTTVSGHYLEESSNFLANLKSDSISYGDLRYYDVDLHQKMDENDMSLNFHTKKIIYKDSLSFDELNFKIAGASDKLFSDLSWGQNSGKPSLIKWSTLLVDAKHYRINLDTSYFHVNSNKWHIENASKFTFNNDTILINSK